MDVVTHALFGAVVGQALYGRRFGRAAAIGGAVAGVVPDLDVVCAFIQPPIGAWLYHRGPTHAIWFGPLIGTLMGWAWARFRRETDPARVRAWIWMMIAALMTHPISDVFTTYGTQILVPFSNHRFAWDGIAIIDLFYSATLLFALAVGRRSGWASSASRRAAWAALLVTSAYMVYGVYLNQRAETLVRASLAEQGVHAGDVHAYPTLLQPYLRRIVVRVGDKVRVGWYDLWSHDQSEWTTIAVPRDPLIEALLLEPEGRIFAWFAMGQIVGSVVETQAGRRVEIDDLRYGWPGDARHGLWGIRAQYDRSGRRQGPIESFHRPRW